jgi:amino acid adenylation domain-containing protein
MSVAELAASGAAEDEVLVFPASFAQERLWFLHRLEPGSSAYNLPAALRLEGALDLPALEAALGELVRRHEALRTTFAEEDGRPVQLVHPAGAFALAAEALDGAAEDEVRRRVRAIADAPFDLAAGPLFAATLLRVADREHVLVLRMHHVIADGWSVGILLRELAALYASFAAGGDSPLAEPRLQYADFAVWQREQLTDDRIAAQLSGWREALAGAPAGLELPADRPRPAAPTDRGEVHAFGIDASAADRLRALCREEGATLFMGALAVFDALLARYGATGDVVVGTPVAGRTRAETEDVVGLFVNTLALRADLSGDPAFRELLRRVKRSTLAAFARQDVPFERVVEALRPDRARGRSPLFQAMLVLQNTPGEGDGDAGGLRLRPFALDARTAKFDLTLHLEERRDGSLSGALEYAADLFDRGTAARIAGHFCALLGAAAADPSASLSALPVLGAHEHRLVTEAWNATARDYPRESTIHALFEAQARATPDAVALVAGGERITYAELNARANRLARFLRRCDVGPEARVGLCLERGAELIVSILAVLKAGGAYLPLDPAYPPARTAQLTRDAGVGVVVTREAHLDRLPVQVNRVVLEQSAARIAGESGDDLPPCGCGDSLAYVLYTSGSTGTPKGVAVPHRAVLRLVRGADFAELTAEHVFLQLAPAGFDASTLEIWGALLNGGRLVVFPPELPTAAALGRVIRAEGVTTLWLTAGLFHQVVDEDVTALRGLRQLLAGGDVLSPAHVARALDALPGCRVVNGYGPTENTTFSCCWTAGRDAPTPSVPLGTPIANTRAYVLDPALRPVPAGVAGELFVAGDGLARGYLGRAALTAERFVPDPFSATPGGRLYRTGDRVRWRVADPGAAVLEFLGRLDRQVKVRGFRIEPGEVEAALAGGEVREAAVVVRRDDGEARLVAYVVPADGAAPTPAGLRARLAERVPGHLLPSAWVVMERLPLTPNGKLDRDALPAPGHASAGERTLPRTPSEAVMAGLFAQLLGMEEIGADDDFFLHGGHSLLATRLVARIAAAFGVELPVRAVFDAPTVAGLAARVDAARGGEALPPVVRVPRDRPLPLSFSQERVWFLDRLEPGGSAYNLPVALGLGGALDVTALDRAVRELVRRHEALRTTFASVHGRPVQVIHPADGFALEAEDLSWADEAALAGRVRALADAPFDLEAGPLFRAVLLRRAADDQVLLLSMHHAVSDGWSVGILLRELAALYTAWISGDGPPLAEPAVHFADFAAWQREHLAGERLDAQLGWWREHLDGAPAHLDLPTDRPRPAERTCAGAIHPVALDAETAARLRALGRAEGATPFMALLAAFGVLLARYAGTDDVVVGTPVAARTRPETEGTVGFFANTLALRADLSGDPSFRALLARVRAATLGAFAHQDLPFEKLVQELNPERSRGHAPIFQAMLVLNAPGETPSLPGVAVRPFGVGGGAAKFDLTLHLEDAPDGIRGVLEYAAELFDAATAGRICAQLATLLRAATDAPDAPVSTLPLVDAAERRRLLEAWNATDRPRPPFATVHEMIEAQAARTPGAVALACGGRETTYAELDRRAGRLARRLRRLGVGPETRVGLCAARTPEMVVGLLAVLKAGGAYLPLDPAYPAERLAFMLRDASVGLLLTQSSLADALPSTGAEVILLDEVLPQDDALEDDAPLPPLAGPENLAYVIYTSGSTGTPKGVGVPHRGVVHYLAWAAEAYGAGEGSGAPVHSSLSFDLTVTPLLAPLAAGGRVVLVPESLGVDGLAEAVREGSDLTLVKLTPTHLSLLARQLPADDAAGRVRTFVVGGENLTADQVAFWRRFAPETEIVNEYGPTETVVGCCVHRVSAEDAGAGSIPIGRPIARTRLYLLDARMQPVPVGVPGELYIGGEGVARGYLGRPALTASRFVPDPFGGTAGARLYRTGDRVRRRADGVLEFLGRLDDQVKVRGYRIEPGEIEAVLRRHPAVRGAAVVVRADGGEPRLVAYVESADPSSVPPAELREHLRGALPAHLVPAAFVALAHLPLTTNGKLDRRALPAPAEAHADADAVARPRTPAEELLAELWAELLGAGRVGADENFFDLGGHSLLATRLLARVAAAFGVELPVRAVFEAPTVTALAARIEAARSDGRAPSPPVAAVTREGPLPLSFAQERLWFLDRLEPGSTVYNVPVVLRLEGALDLAALERAVAGIVRRHEALRTTFATVDGAPVQVIHDAGGATLSVEDAAAMDDDALRARIEALAAAPFDLERGPLFRAVLLRRPGHEHVLLLLTHHVVSDGWSVGVLLREVAALYTSFASGAGSPLAPLPVQYADYAAWQRTHLEGARLDAQLGWWRERLAGAPAVLELPADRPRPAVRSHRGAVHRFAFDADVAARLRAFCRAEGATPFMALLAAFDVLLARYAGVDDVVVGTPVAGRTRAEVEPVIGFFVNTLALRADLSGDPSFREMVARVRETTLGAFAHQELPFEKLVEELRPGRSRSHSPLFQVLVVFQNTPGGSLEMKGLRALPVEPACRHAKFDLSLHLEEAPEGLRGQIEYATDLFDAETAGRIAGHLRVLLAAALADPETPVSDLPLLTDGERRTLLEAWNDTARGYPGGRCLHERFEAQARRTPDADAVVFGERRTTYRELDARAGRLARRLRRLGVGPEVRVGLCVHRGDEMVVALLAILKAGGAYVPLDPAYPAARVAFMLRDSAVPVLVTQSRLAETLPPIAAHVVLLDREMEVDPAEADAEGGDPPAAGVLPENLAYLIYTSGSTGVPKGVAIAHASAVTLVDWALETFPREELAGVLASTSLCFDLSVWEIFLPLACGGKVIVAENALRLPELPARGEVTMVNTVPSAAAALLRMGGLPRGLPALCLAGEPLKAELVRQLYAGAGVRAVHDLYGPSEDTTYSTWERVPADVETVLIGTPIADTRCYVLDAAMRPVPAGVVGELYIGGAGLARGYLGRPALTAEKFVPDPFGPAGSRLYRTGDRARWRGGKLDFLGRLDHQVKIRGFRIEPGEVEAVLVRHPGVRECAVLARDDGDGGMRLVAYVVPDGGRGDPSLLRAHLRERLPEYMVPAAWVALDALPLTPNGKLDRARLPEPGRASGDADAHVAPRDAVERRLAALWEQVLRTAPVGVRDDFFALGGHSLLAARLMAEVRAEFGRDLPLAMLFDGATVERMADALRDRSELRREPLVAIQRGGPGRPVLFAVHPIGGNVLIYRELSRSLGADQPFYGLQDVDQEGLTAPSVEEMAGRYVDVVRGVRPAGPYHLLGQSFGGLVAFEMARQLAAAGEEVALLALLDTQSPAVMRRSRGDDEDPAAVLAVLAREHARSFGQELELHAAELRGMELDAQLATVADRLRAHGRIDALDLETLRRVLRVFMVRSDAALAYDPPPYDGPLTLFRAAELHALDARDLPGSAAVFRDFAAYGWDALARGPLEVRVVPGDHVSMSLSPNVETLAAELREAVGLAADLFPALEDLR